MVGMMARDFEGWMAKQEREVSAARRAPIAIVGNAIEIVRGEMAELGTRKPTAPIELTYQTANYFSGAGYPAVRFIMDFPDVTMGTDGQPITVNQYELWGRDVTPGLLGITTSAAPGLAAPGLTAPGLANTFTQQQAEAAQRDTKWLLMGTASESGFRVDDFVPMSVWEFKARAISPSSSVPGNFSTVVTVLMQKDTSPPPQPTAPTLLSDRGVLRVEWDGQSVSGAMPADFSYAILAQGDGAEPTFEVARFGRVGGIYIATGLEYYDPQFFRVKAFDESGNEGPWSAVATGFTEPLVDRDIILSEIDAAETLIKNIDGNVSIKDGTVAASKIIVTEELTGNIAQFLQVKADMIDANELWADEAFFGAADAYLVRSDMFIGKQFEGGVFTATAGGKFQTNVEDLKGVKMRETGIFAWNSTSGEQTYSLDAATGNVVATGIFQTSPTGTRTMLWDHGDGIAAIDMFPSAGDMHGALFSQPTSGGTRGGYQTNLQHYETMYQHSAYVTLYQDGTWAMGTLDVATSGSTIFADGVTGDVFLQAKGTGTTKNLIVETDKGYLYLHNTGAAATGNIFITSDNGALNLTGNNGMTVNAGTKTLSIYGKLPVVGGGGNNGTFYVWVTGTVTNVTGYAWTVTYQQPVPTGLRRVFVTPEGNDYVSFSINTQAAGSFKANHKPEGAAPLGAITALQFLGIWVDQ